MAELPSGNSAGPTSSLARRLVEVASAFFPLGWIAFGGPQAHIALLQERFVARRQWLDEERFVELLGLGQGLPGPTSTQMVVAVGTVRAGPLGGLLAPNPVSLPGSNHHGPGRAGRNPLSRRR